MAAHDPLQANATHAAVGAVRWSKRIKDLENKELS